MDPNNNALANIPEGKGTDLANLNMQQIMYVGKLMFDAGMFTDVKSLATAQVKVMAGQELGLTPFQAMNSFHIIHGRATMAANLMASKIKGSGRYDYRVVVLNDELCHVDVYELQPKREKIGESRFTLEDAKAAGTQNIGKFTRNMLFARAISNAAKWYCPDVFGGQAVYVPGEVVEDPAPVNDAGESVEDIEKRLADQKQAKRDHAAKAGARRTEAKVAEQTPDKTDDKTPIETPAAQTKEELDAVGKEAADRIAPAEPEFVADTPAEKPDGAAEFDKAIAGETTEPETTDDFMAPIAIPHTPVQRRRIMAMLNELGFTTDADKKAIYTGMTGKTSFKDLSEPEASELIGALEMADPDWLRETYLEAADGQ